MPNMSITPNSLYISEITTKFCSLEQDVACYQRHGLGIELWEEKFNDEDYARQIGWVGDQDIRVSSLQPKVMTVYPSFSVPEPVNPSDRLGLLCRAVDRFSSILRGGVIPTQTGAVMSGNEAAVWDTAVEFYKRLAEHGAKHDVRIAIEPLGASLMNRSTIIFNMSTALEMVHEVDHPYFGVCADSYNLWASGALEQVALCGEKLFLVHLADWKRPRGFHDRHIPGDGIIPLGFFIQQIEKLGYSGSYVIELFSANVPDSLWSQNPDAVVSSSKSGVLQARMDREHEFQIQH
jgi:sugar phosphate isomerase/epimerase